MHNFMIFNCSENIVVVLNPAKSTEKKIDVYFLLVKDSIFTNSYILHYKLGYQALLVYFQCTKIKLFIKDFPSKCDHIHSSLRIWSQFPKKSLMENFLFFPVFRAIVAVPRTKNPYDNQQGSI